MKPEVEIQNAETPASSKAGGWASRRIIGLHMLACAGLIVFPAMVLTTDTLPLSIALVIGIVAMKYGPEGRIERIVIGLCVFVAALFFTNVPAILTGNKSSWRYHRQHQCANSIRQLGLAMTSYMTQHDDQLPPAVLKDDQGRPLHSWITQILPYMEEKRLYEKIDLTKPWDDPANAAFTSKNIRWLRCLMSKLEDDRPGMTNYVLVVGPGSAYAAYQQGKPMEEWEELPLIVEIETPVPWAKPYYLTVDDLPPGETDLRRLTTSNHSYHFPLAKRYVQGGYIGLLGGGTHNFEHNPRTSPDWLQVGLAAIYLGLLLPALFIRVRKPKRTNPQASPAP